MSWSEVNHILFQVTPNVDLDALRQRAQSVLDELTLDPSAFAAAAKKYSNCPSAEVGGNLGQLSRGETYRNLKSDFRCRCA